MAYTLMILWIRNLGSAHQKWLVSALQFCGALVWMAEDGWDGSSGAIVLASGLTFGWLPQLFSVSHLLGLKFPRWLLRLHVGCPGSFGQNSRVSMRLTWRWGEHSLLIVTLLTEWVIQATECGSCQFLKACVQKLTWHHFCCILYSTHQSSYRAHPDSRGEDVDLNFQWEKWQRICVPVFVFVLFCFFLGPYPRHMEVPRLGV